MVDEQVVRREFPDHVSIVNRQRLESRVRGFDDDLGVETCSPERPLDAQDFVSDGVSVAQRGQNLMDPRATRCRCHLSAGPDGALATTSLAGGHCARRLAKKPGSGSIAGAGSRERRSNMSRYFRSI